MSHPLVSRSDDLSRLGQDGYDLEIRGGNLLVHHVPYLAAGPTPSLGILVSELSHNGTATIAPGSHEIWFVGSYPCDNHGRVLDELINQRVAHDFGQGVVACCSFSQKPPSGAYGNYYDKITTYIRLLSGYAKAVDPTMDARAYPPRETTSEESVFRYEDAASSRAGISATTAKLELGKVAIVGLGGTGAYILDLLAKTPVQELHLFDDDSLYAHNAFRTPGAASLQELQSTPKKVDYLFRKYDPIRRNIFPHPVRIGPDNVDEVAYMDFVFLAMDASSAKQVIVEKLEAANVRFIDCGMGLYRQAEALAGVVRVTASSDGHRDHLRSRVSFADETQNEYDWNIQTADMNMLNAALAVIKWKKMCGYYADSKQEFHFTYTIARNQLLSGDLAE